MAVASVRYRPQGMRSAEETKTGFVVYGGTAVDFGSWKFRSEFRMMTAKGDDRARAMSIIVEALRGEALQAAVDIGMKELTKEVRSRCL